MTADSCSQPVLRAIFRHELLCASFSARRNR